VSTSRITGVPDTEITPDQAQDARARAWAYVFQCHDRREEIEGGPAAAPLTRKEFNMNGSRQVYASRYPYELAIFLPNAETARTLLLQLVAIPEHAELELGRVTA
jgi:hypothetical protein